MLMCTCFVLPKKERILTYFVTGSITVPLFDWFGLN